MENEKIEVKVWIDKNKANLFKDMARQNGMTRSEFFGEILNQYIIEKVS